MGLCRARHRRMDKDTAEQVLACTYCSQMQQEEAARLVHLKER